ncbi:protein phosphatase 2C domain-containing protein [Actinokineospora sp. NBRC 105648]|uniref:PP2C family protein-serine/threonine phosphatase n=1 Tax=Actinokineospora sp. NBRC 105648 TaxID=3032206 RepID=UPI0024A3AA51|nr:protein phosphatase 2C domain-containing protein [Actinokineospora sp. NBRC 105648]GLZ40409.1 serine/threonine protein phosphatase [Actinokineospora sp. NBRC 105648]
MSGEPTIRAGAASDVGLVRAANEDNFVLTGTVFAVADGMGGHAAGDVASGLAVAGLARLGAEQGTVRPDDVRRHVMRLNADILAAAARNPEQAGMGTTVTGICLVDFAGSAHWVVFNVGDSRVYRLADKEFAQLTVDHSEVTELVAAGELSPAEAATDPRRNVVTRALGAPVAPEPDLLVFPPTVGDRFLLCSDGLTGELDDGTIADILAAEPDPRAAAERLVRAAVAAGGRDNVTAVVVDHVADAPGVS